MKTSEKTSEMKSIVQDMSLEELRVEFGRLLDVEDGNSEWTKAVRGELKKRWLLPSSEPGVVRWK